MGADYQITLPWPPSANTYYRRSGRHIHLSNKGRKFKTDAMATLKSLRLDAEQITERLTVRMELHPPNRRKFDIDNRIKPVLDALQRGGLIVDDEQIDDLRIKRGDHDTERRGFVIISLNIAA